MPINFTTQVKQTNATEEIDDINNSVSIKEMEVKK